MRPSLLFLFSSTLTGCALFRPPLTAFPVDHGGPGLASMASAVGQAYELDTPNVRVRRVAFGDQDWNVERSADGVIVRRTISAFMGYQSTKNGSCGVDDIVFAEDSNGLGAWASVRVYGVANGQDIACDLLGGGAKEPERPSQVARAPVSPDSPTRKPSAFDKSASDLNELVAKETDGFQIEGAAVSGDLEKFAPPAIPLKRGKCYLMVLRLGAGAAFSDHARKGVALLYHGVDGYDEINAGPGVGGPGAVARAGCPQKDAPNATFDVVATSMSASDKTRLHDLGTGSFTLQLYSKPVSDAELAKQADNNAKQDAASEEANRKEKRARCAECRHDEDLCAARSETKFTCESDYDSCLFRGGVQRDACQ